MLRIEKVHKRVAHSIPWLNNLVPRRAILPFRQRRQKIATIADKEFVARVTLLNFVILALVQDLEADKVSPNQSEQIPIRVKAVANLR